MVCDDQPGKDKRIKYQLIEFHKKNIQIQACHRKMILQMLCYKQAKLVSSTKEKNDVEPLLNKAISNLSQLDVLYTQGTITQKRKIISSMFPENLTFDGFQYRTNRINEAITLISLVDKKLKDKKMGQI